MTSRRWNAETKFGVRNLESRGYIPYGEGIMIVGRITWAQSTSVTDRQTDVQIYDE